MKTRITADDVAEMEAAVERLREEIQRLKKEREALERGNLDLYRKLTAPPEPDF